MKTTKLGREIHVETADSGKWDLTTKEWLPGGVLSAVRGKITSLIDEKKIVKEKYRNWIGL